MGKVDLSKENLLTPKPVSKRRKILAAENVTPFMIPPSPCMKQLGYGTGVNVYLYERFSPVRGCYKSPWAVKKINSKLPLSDIKSECRERLEQEAKLLQSLNHPNIIGYRSAPKCEDGNLCLVMESGEGSLADLIEIQADNQLGPIPPENILKVSKALASALEYLHHDKKIMHGDLKSANVLIKGDFEIIKLCDFGVTLKLDENLTINSEEEFYVGTECWSAPEVFKGESITNKTDIFSYGLIIWEMLTLSIPHVDKLDEVSLLEGTSSSPGASEKSDLEREKAYQESLGKRPELPTSITKNCSYKKILELFCVCTEEEQSKRPTAKQIMSIYFS